MWKCKICGSEVVLANKIVEISYHRVNKNKNSQKKQITNSNIEPSTDNICYICSNGKCYEKWLETNNYNNCYDIEEIAYWEKRKKHVNSNIK
jgi:hypothetical protein